MNNYFNNDLNHPKYLFYGSPKLLEVIEQHQSHDSNDNSENEVLAVFLTSSFIMASAYAFKDSIKKISAGLDWKFVIEYDADKSQVNIEFENVNIDDNIEGYIYVCPFNENYGHNKHSTQYKCYQDVIPIDVVKVRFADFKKYYSINKKA